MGRPEPEPTLDIAHGDVALSKHLKNSLNLLRNKVDDPEFKNLVDDITAGRKSLRDAVTSPVLARALDPLMEQASEHYRNLSEQEREELARTGEQQFEELRQEEEAAPAAGRRRPDDDDEDEDFSDRNWIR
ncbi:DUF3348 domain-containing protein [Amycolatopsis cihanbeyliensis]|uniref:Uncharacterized protein n=1 Tax=Amycolatopsis cihanbeyliensis TaxID=1128664 RepID=A0A542DHD6_AMYCI|nr:DUF3348 domain-containing protein [Amycolatopsis cihanbeyliensis]TQJ02446.1 hypothetical protein FB471_2175 [Amycolatopsis cihanbeyliensis]